MAELQDAYPAEKPEVFVFSDARGTTAVSVVEAAADQFVDDVITIRQLGNVADIETVQKFLDTHLEKGEAAAVFHTIVDPNLRRAIRRELDERGIPSIDLLGPSIAIISTLTGEEPKYETGRRTQIQIEQA